MRPCSPTCRGAGGSACLGPGAQAMERRLADLHPGVVSHAHGAQGQSQLGDLDDVYRGTSPARASTCEAEATAVRDLAGGREDFRGLEVTIILS